MPSLRFRPRDISQFAAGRPFAQRQAPKLTKNSIHLLVMDLSVGKMATVLEVLLISASHLDRVLQQVVKLQRYVTKPQLRESRTCLTSITFNKLLPKLLWMSRRRSNRRLKLSQRPLLRASSRVNLRLSHVKKRRTPNLFKESLKGILTVQFVACLLLHRQV